MNENQIVLSLLNFYKSEGIDLHQILDDPIFNSLSLPTKIQMIKAHAQAIHDGTSSGMTKRDWKSLGRDMLLHGAMGAMTGAAATATTAKLFTGGRPSAAAVALGAAAAAGSGLGISTMRRLSSQRDRNELKRYIGNVANAPTDESALGILVKRHLQNVDRKENMGSFNKFIDRVSKGADERAKNVAMKETVRENTEAGRPWANQ